MPKLYTIGHSTRTAEAFRDLLAENGVRLLIDVRRFPGSRRWPHFNADAMRQWLSDAQIDYRHEPDLGGRRKGNPDSPNGYWTNDSFRAYADYLSTPEFRAALARLVGLAQERPTAIACSEAVPWRCHRRLIADVLVSRGFEVLDILRPGHAEPHVLNPHAVVQSDGTLIYPAEDATVQQRLPGLG